METSTPFYAYKETRLDLDSPTQESTVAIRLPAYGATINSYKTAQKRPHIADTPVAEDENTFRQRHLASAASIYHRIHYTAVIPSPRSFLWRVLDDGKVLSIRSVDVSKPNTAADASITLRLTLPSGIRPGCIAFSDSKHDVLSVFILTESKQLYTLNLRMDYFHKAASTENNVGEWCKVYLSAGLGIKHPHRLVALSTDELLISMVDGGLLRLEKSSSGDGSTWKEIHYNEGGWSLNFRTVRLFNSANHIQYGGQSLELSTATSIASPATLLRHTPFAFTVCLDHRLRVWNLENGKLAYSKDILGQELEPHEQARRGVDPSQSQLVKVFSWSEHNALCVTYSPLGSGLFKFWDVTSGHDGSIDLEDMFPQNALEPQAPSTEVWTLADFSLVLHKADTDSLTLWALWKNNVTYRLHRLVFQRSGTREAVQDAWEENWLAMANETLPETPTPTVFSGDSSDVTDKWLEFLLCPGRFTIPTIETGLAIYGRGLGTSKAAARKSGALPERLCATIASTAALNRTSTGDMDYEQFRAAVDAQWRRFFRLLQELDKQRGEAMSLAIDPQGEMPWIALADGITAIRDCSPLEKIWHNPGAVLSENDYVARPLFAAATFRDSLPDQFLHSCKTRLLDEIFQDPSLTTPSRMRKFYEVCDFTNQIGDEEYAQLVSGLGGDFKHVTPQVYSAILSMMNATGDLDRATVRELAEFGNKLLVKGVSETVELHRNICLDQLILLVLIENEINHEEEGIQFETAAVFGELMTLLKSLEQLHWLVSTQITVDNVRSERSNSVTDEASSSTKQVSVPKTVTVLEGVFRHLFGLDLRPGELLPPVVTEVITQICAPDSEHYVAPPAVKQCFLLKQARPDLAIEFSRFAEHDPFSTYIQGRACLAANDAVAASILFKKAAFGIAYPDPKKRNDYRTAGYIDGSQRKHLNAGLPEYYSHIVALFDKERNYSFVVDFARLSLQFTNANHENTKSFQLCTEMHSRLFNAAIQTARYEVAHSVLSLFTDSALQHSSLRTLVTKMCESSYASQLIDLPFIGLQDTIDEILTQQCQSIVDVNVGVPYHKILYSWRIKHGDFRGASAISLERLQKLQQSGDGDRMIGDDNLETPVTKQFVALINALSCVDPKQAWILSEEIPQKSSSASVGGKKTPPKRQVVTLHDVRRAYQAELDRIAAIQNNQFAFGDDDEMDVL